MYIKFSYDEGFEHLLLNLKDKYPKKLLELNGIDEVMLDTTKFSQNYFLKKKTSESTVDSNANVQIRNVATFLSEKFKAHNKLDSLHLLWKTAVKFYGTQKANELIEKEINKDINMQDAGNAFLPYCWAFDTYDLLVQGLPFISNYPSKPAKHANTFLQHTIQLLQYAAPQLMGATAVPDLVVIYSAMIKHDSEDESYFVPNYKTDKNKFEVYVKQQFQELIYLLNQPLRISQSLFTNITIFDSIFMKELCSLYCMPWGDFIDPDFAMYIQRLFLDTVSENNKIRLATFPVLTAQFKTDEENNVEDQDFLNYISNINLDFANLNIFSSKNLTALSSCCRLVNNVEDMIKQTKEEHLNLIGGSTIKVGSFGVTTLNLARLGILYKDNEEQYFIKLKELATDCYRLNHCRKKLIEDKINQGEMPLYTLNFMNIKNQYSTLGINGLYESLDFMGKDIKIDDGKNFAIKVLQVLQNICDQEMKKYGYKCNIEQIPAEVTAIKLADADNILYKQDKYNLYANQFLPLIEDADIFDRIELQAELEKFFSGGTILHLNVKEKIQSSEVMKKIINIIIKQGVKYFAINYFFKRCKNNHYLNDNGFDTCEVCGEEIIDKITRIVGFFTPVSAWKKERQNEYNNRKKYDL